MVSGEADCPYCHDRKPLPGFNTFKVRHPDLMKEWMWLNNYVLADPDNILDSFSTPLWWDCPKGSNTNLQLKQDKIQDLAVIL